ncbi:Hypothetical predicted protein [Mytilus galloprovincialis]|uniref:Novel STAND NTPase 3 domain-containing protein n=1 Tax=Mytilus galloprovincialis TaxID=29158 RepID=A0A8B6GM87_MYTGA|nr:Hypothetical predicted protein [Mytilus galloprovincialis]
MTNKARENFYRSATVIVDHGKEAMTAVLDDDLSKRNLTFVDFINQNQHELYHLCYNRRPCCQCINNRIPLGTPSSRILHENQLDVLLDKSGPRLPNHNPQTRSTFCCCLAKHNLSSACLDITLTRCLLLNFAVNCRTTPHLKQTIENLIEYRNKIYGHAKEAKITDADYQKYKTALEHILLTIARFCKFEDRMKQNLLDAEQRPLDSTILLQYQNFLLQELKQQSDTENKLEEIQQQISTNSSIVHSELAKIDDRITKMDNRKQNIIDQTKACIAQHEEDETYCPTLGVTTACEVMEKNNIVIIMSNQGGGKSKTSLQIATIYKEKHFYQPMIFFSDDIVRYRDLLNFNEQSLFILEDLFGRTTLSFDEDTHRGIFDILYSCISQPSCKSKFIITMKGNQQTNRKILEKHKLFKKEVILELDLNQHEVNRYFKKAILLKHMSKHNIKSCGTFHERFTQCISEIVENSDTSLQICSASIEAIYTSRFESETGFPLACHLFCSNKNFTRQGIRYFSRASQALVEEINQLRIKGFDNNLYMYKYSLLVYTALKDTLNVDNIDQQLLKSILGHFENQTPIKTVLIKEAFSYLKETYMIEQYSMLHFNRKRSKLSDTYMLQHSTVKEAILISYADFVGFSHCDAEFIYDYVRPKGFRDQKSEDMTFVFTDCKPLVKKLLSLASGNRACFSIGQYLKITGLKNRNDTLIKHFFEEAKDKIRIKQYAFILDGLTDYGSENDFILFHPDISTRIVLYGSADAVCSFCKPMECPLSKDGFVKVKGSVLHTRLYSMLIGETFQEYETGSENEGLNYIKENVEFNHCMEFYSNKRNEFFDDVQKIGNYVYQLLFIEGGKKVSEMILFDLVVKQCTMHPRIVKYFFDGLTDSGRRVDFVKYYRAFSEKMVFRFASIPVVLNLCRP